MTTTPTDAEQLELIDALARTAFTTMALLSRLAAEHELSLTQLRVLGILRDRQLTMSGLADHLGLDRSSVSGLIDRTEKRGLVERTRSASDGRSVEVRLSADGVRAAARGTASLTESMASITGALAPAEARRLTTLLERLVDVGTPSPS